MFKLFFPRKASLLASTPLKYFAVKTKEIEFFIKYREKPEEPVRKLKGEIGSVFGKVLESHKVPLAFECMLSCECATCAISFESENDYVEISKAQPMDTEEKVPIVLPDEDLQGDGQEDLLNLDSL